MSDGHGCEQNVSYVNPVVWNDTQERDRMHKVIMRSCLPNLDHSRVDLSFAHTSLQLSVWKLFNDLCLESMRAKSTQPVEATEHQDIDWRWYDPRPRYLSGGLSCASLNRKHLSKLLPLLVSWHRSHLVRFPPSSLPPYCNRFHPCITAYHPHPIAMAPLTAASCVVVCMSACSQCIYFTQQHRFEASLCQMN